MKFKSCILNALTYLSIFLSIFAFSEDLSIYDVTFEKSMESFYNPEKDFRYYIPLKRSYEDNHFLRVLESKPSDYQSIPKIIHQIWIGPNKLPEKCAPLMETWIKNHPDWEYKLWTNEDLETFDPVSQRAIFNAKNIGSKVDIFKYEILNRYGGVYVDADFQCIKPLDIIVENSRFFAGIYAYTSIGNGIIGSIKNHPILEHLLLHFKKRQLSSFKNPLKHTGPKLFTHVIKAYINNPKNDPIAIYPVSFFHPYPRMQREKYWKKNISLEELTKYYAKPETFAIHYWANSWM